MKYLGDCICSTVDDSEILRQPVAMENPQLLKKGFIHVRCFKPNNWGSERYCFPIVYIFLNIPGVAGHLPSTVSIHISLGQAGQKTRLNFKLSLHGPELAE